MAFEVAFEWELFQEREKKEVEVEIAFEIAFEIEVEFEFVVVVIVNGIGFDTFVTWIGLLIVRIVRNVMIVRAVNVLVTEFLVVLEVLFGVGGL